MLQLQTVSFLVTTDEREVNVVRRLPTVRNQPGLSWISTDQVAVAAVHLIQENRR